jgi:hypothetical protein
MKKILVLSSLAFSLQSFAALEVGTKDNTLLTKAAQAAVLEYVDANCTHSNNDMFFPIQIEEQSTVITHDNTEDDLHHKMTSELFFYFNYSDDFEYVKADIEESRVSVTQPWTAKVVKFHGAYFCRQIE